MKHSTMLKKFFGGYDTTVANNVVASKSEKKSENDNDKDYDTEFNETLHLDSDNKDEDTDDDEDYNEDYTLDYLKNPIYKDENVEIFKSDARDIINIPSFDYQRPVDEKHVEILAGDIKKSGYVFGAFSIVKVKDGENVYVCRIIDGQHRSCALKKIMEKDSKFNPSVILHCYEVESLDSDEARDLFRKLNNVKNVELSGMPNEIVAKVMDILSLKFQDMFRPTKCSRPRIHKQFLIQKLKFLIKDNDISVIKLYQNIIKKNNQSGLTERTKFRQKVGDKMYETAKTNGFYLGLDSELRWVNEDLLK